MYEELTKTIQKINQLTINYMYIIKFNKQLTREPDFDSLAGWDLELPRAIWGLRITWREPRTRDCSARIVEFPSAPPPLGRACVGDVVTTCISSGGYGIPHPADHCRQLLTSVSNNCAISHIQKITIPMKRFSFLEYEIKFRKWSPDVSAAREDWRRNVVAAKRAEQRSGTCRAVADLKSKKKKNGSEQWFSTVTFLQPTFGL